MTLITFFHIQLSRILGKGPIHTKGPKKPSLSELDNGKG